jgi:hypothetical protein
MLFCQGHDFTIASVGLLLSQITIGTVATNWAIAFLKRSRKADRVCDETLILGWAHFGV